MKLLEKILTACILALFTLMIALVSIQIVNRYGIGLSIPWTEELTRTAYVLLIFVGSSLAVLQCNHIRVLSVVNLLPVRIQRVLAFVGALASAVFFVFVAYGNWIYTVVNIDSRFTTISWLNIGYVIAIVLISSLLSAGLFVYRAYVPCEKNADELEKLQDTSFAATSDTLASRQADIKPKADSQESNS